MFNKETQEQIASVMLQHGTPEQKVLALKLVCGASDGLVRYVPARGCGTCRKQLEAPDNCGDCGDDGSTLKNWDPVPGVVLQSSYHRAIEANRMPSFITESEAIEVISRHHSAGTLDITTYTSLIRLDVCSIRRLTEAGESFMRDLGVML